MKIGLYDYQAESKEGLRENIRRGTKTQILASPTGSGKTVIAASLLEDCWKKEKNAIFICDRIPLIEQTSQTLDQYGIPHGVIQADHWRRRAWERIQVASAQTLGRRGWPQKLDLIIVDEAHTINMAVAKRVAQRDTVVIGLTATPFTRGLGKYYDAVVTVTTTNWLIEQGYLSPFRVFAASEPDMTGVKVVRGEWSEEETVSRAIPIIGDVVAEYLKHGAWKKFIAFGVNVDHCHELQRQFMEAGVQCATYSYRTSDTERRELIEEFRKPDSFIRGLISVSALAKGFDVPDVEVVIMARPLRSSFAEHIQILGRGMRAHPTKKECIILDHAGNCVRFWDRMQDFFENGTRELSDGKRTEKKEKAERERKPFKCDKCAHVHDPLPACPACGFVYPERRVEVKSEAGELRELTGTNVVGAERHAFYAQLLYIARERGKKDGWADHLYRDRVGVWPHNKKSIEPMRPTAEVRGWVQHKLIAYAKSQAAA